MHQDIVKYTYDAIIFNIDSMNKVCFYIFKLYIFFNYGLIFFQNVKTQINDLTLLKSSDKKMLGNLVDEVLSRKWPKNQNETGIFNFIFECNHFLARFFYLGR
jgi:hypothetical protein